MEKIFVYAAVLLVGSLSVVSCAQTPGSSLDQYLKTGKTIIVAKCIEVGPPNILLKARVEVQILHVVKGKETLRTISVLSQYGMKPGELYLLRTENEAAPDAQYFETNTRDSVVPIWSGENIEELKKLSPTIIVLRTMNMRVDDLEAEIRRLTYELDALKAARREN